MKGGHMPNRSYICHREAFFPRQGNLDTSVQFSLFPFIFKVTRFSGPALPESNFSQSHLAVCVRRQQESPDPPLRVEFLLKTESGYLRDAEVTFIRSHTISSFF